MKIKLINTFILFLCFLKIQAQDKTASSLTTIQRVENKQYLYKGIPNISIPILDIELSDLKYNMILNYNTEGFKPNISESIYGLNWNTNSFGSIVRLTKKTMFQPVFMGNISFDTEHKRCIREEKSISNNGTKKDILETPSLFLKNKETATYGFDPDEYYFDFFGNKGYFIFDNLGNPIVNSENNSIQVLPYDPLIDGVNCQPLWEGVTFSQFRLKDDKGNIFYFGGDYDNLDINYVEAIYTSQCFCPDNPLGYLQNNYLNVSKANYILEWKLKKVELTNGEIIEASYRKAVNKDLFNNFLSERKKKDINTPIQFPFPSNESLKNNNTPINRVPGFTSFNINGEITTSNDIRIRTKTSLLESINFGNKYSIEYKYLLDDNAHPSLTNIKLKNRSKIIKNINFNQKLKGGNYSRYFLENLNINDDIYSFEYYKTDQLPPRETTNDINTVNSLGFWNGILPSSPKKDNIYDATLLSKIIYPTKGFKHFQYEPNDISNIYRSDQTPSLSTESIQDIGGSRIKRIVTSENNSSIEYTYKKEDGITSSGAVSRQVVMGLTPRSIYDRLTYSRVEENIKNKGKNIFYYNDIVSIPDSIISFTPRDIISLENRRGKIIKEVSMDINNKKLTENNYKYKTFNPPHFPIKEISKNCNDCMIYDQNYYVHIYTDPYSNPSNPIYKSGYKPTLPYFPISKTSIEYFPNSIIKSEEQINYNNKYLYWHPYPVETSITQSDETKTFKTYYPHDILREKCPTGDCSDNLNVGGQYSTYKYMIDNNIIKPIIITETNSKNKTKLTEHIYKKDNTTANILKENKTRVSLSNQDISPAFPELAYAEDKILFDLYDTKGNLLQYTEKGNKHTVIIWGYNQTQPIAKIEGATYVELANKLDFSNTNAGYLDLEIVSKSNADIDILTEQNLIDALDNFRNLSALSGYQITTYTYDPLIGVTSITPPSGIREIYKYDTANRLESVKDVNGNMLKEYNYQYAVVFYNEEKSQPFTRNNCTSGSIPGIYKYIVPAKTYSSTVSPADADQKAQNDINANGQGQANLYADCTPVAYCTFTPVTTGISATFIPSGDSVNYSLNFGSSTKPYFNFDSKQNLLIGKIDVGCAPTSRFQIGKSEGGRYWLITIEPSGNFYLQLLNGSVSSGSFIISDSYSKNGSID
ncbi:DUF5977 domain-containing protein [Elizabethkingia meningoseptica]|uniref:DUF5977 domain-containing protein n=1 Tax=Elizabethkingia meningoseptica TaxID=238 RepID=UPI0023B1C7F2|nr:DUF5977 domain-containing protein [Elizabethkingia meningoseptica]MDE5432781.1 hypothetical protein [Elizabethkingia meningoseptica]